MITRNSLLTLKNSIKEMSSVIDSCLMPLTSHEKLFETQADYYEAMKNQNKVPQDYYKFRFFDIEIYLYYDFKLKRYFLREDYNKTNEDLGNDFKKALIRFVDSVSDFCTESFRKLVVDNNLF